MIPTYLQFARKYIRSFTDPISYESLRTAPNDVPDFGIQGVFHILVPVNSQGLTMPLSLLRDCLGLFLGS